MSQPPIKEQTPIKNQKALADRVSCSETWLSQVLAGKACGSDDLYDRIFEITKISRRLLITGRKSRIKAALSKFFKEQRLLGK